MSKDYYRLEQRKLLQEYRKIARRVERKTESDFHSARAMEYGLTMEQIADLVKAGVPVQRVAECYPWTSGAIPHELVSEMIADNATAKTQLFSLKKENAIDFKTRKTVYVLCTWVDEHGGLQMGLAQVAEESERWLAWCHGSTEGDGREVNLIVLRALMQQEMPREFRWCILDGNGWPVITPPQHNSTTATAALTRIVGAALGDIEAMTDEELRQEAEERGEDIDDVARQVRGVMRMAACNKDGGT